MNFKDIVLESDEIGVLSIQNQVSKYWGVSMNKAKTLFIVRFYDRQTKKMVQYTPEGFELTEHDAAKIAKVFYHVSTTPDFSIKTDRGILKVNVANRKITFEELPVIVQVVEQKSSPVISEQDTSSLSDKEFSKLLNSIVLGGKKALNKFKNSLVGQA